MDIPQTLRNDLQAGRVIPFVGPGVSMAVAHQQTKQPLFPSWKTLLERAADRLDIELKSNEAFLVRAFLNLEEPRYMEAAKHAQIFLGSSWLPFLKDQLSFSQKDADNESLELARLVWRLGSRLIITTNYDRVLHWTSPSYADLAFWNIQVPDAQADMLRNGVQRPTVWHLHGYIDNATELIFSPDDYRRLYGAAELGKHRYQAALHTLKQLMTYHSFLFVGFSLDDANFDLQLQGIQDIFGGTASQHYALVHESERERVENYRLFGIHRNK